MSPEMESAAQSIEVVELQPASAAKIIILRREPAKSLRKKNDEPFGRTRPGQKCCHVDLSVVTMLMRWVNHVMAN